MNDVSHQTAIDAAEIPGLYRASCTCGWVSPSGHAAPAAAEQDGVEHKRVQAVRHAALHSPATASSSPTTPGSVVGALALHLVGGIAQFFLAAYIDLSKYGIFCSGEPDSIDTAVNVLSISWLLVGALVVWQARRGPRAWLWSCAWFFVAITIFAGVVSSGPEPDCSIV